jgi:hypothetical protein
VKAGENLCSSHYLEFKKKKTINIFNIKNFPHFSHKLEENIPKSYTVT